MGQIFGGRYELVDPLNRGGAGTIWRVWDRRDRAYRAGKVLHQSDSTALLRFVQETGRRFDHPHILRPLGWCGEDDSVMFAMPLVTGGSLAVLLADHGRLPLDWVVGIADQLLDALGVVHAEGLVHRDVKPGNVLLEPGFTPHVWLGDFGIAAKVGDPRLTRVTQIVGTPGYQSPEAELGADPDPRQDLWAMGVLVAEMLVGRRDPVVPPELVGTQLGGWIGRLLAPVEQRTATAARAREQLQQLDLSDVVGLGFAASGEVEVFDHMPELPPGWGPHGPALARSMTPASAASAISAQTGPSPRQSVATLGQPGEAPQQAVAASSAQPLTGATGSASWVSHAAVPAAVARPAKAVAAPPWAPWALIGLGGLLMLAALIWLL